MNNKIRMIFFVFFILSFIIGNIMALIKFDDAYIVMTIFAFLGILLSYPYENKEIREVSGESEGKE